MLMPAVLMEDDLNHKYKNEIHDERYDFFYFQNYTEYPLVIDKNDWNRFQFVSVNNENILGYLEARVDRMSQVVEDLLIINFENKKSGFIFAKDFSCFIYYLFEKRNIQKIFFRYLDGNPAAKLYKKLFYEKIGCGKLIGVMESAKTIRNGKTYDLIINEIDKKIFVDWYENIFCGKNRGC